MSKIVKHNEFKKVIDALWEKSKDVYSYFWEACKYFEKDKASLNKDNVFVGKNTFNEVNLIGKNAFVESIGNIQGTGHKNNVYCGNREVSTHKNTPPQGKQYVSALKIRILDSVNIGDTVSGICVAEVEKITNRVDDIVRKTIVSNGTFIVEEDANYDKCIYVPVQKEYSNDTYFLIGQKGAKSDLREYHLNNPSQCINGLDIDSLPTEGSQLNHNSGSGWLIIHSLVSDEINVREKLNSISSNLDNKVDQNQLTTTSKANGVVQLNAQGKIDSSMLGAITTNDVHVVADENEANNMVTQGTANKGDIFLLRDTKKSYMYTNTTGNDFATRFSELTVATGTLFSVNNVSNSSGHITLRASDIDATVGVDTLKVDEHLARMNNKLIQTEAEAQSARSEVNVLRNHVNTNIAPKVNAHDTDIVNLNATTNTLVRDVNTLKAKHPNVKLGDIISTFQDSGNDGYVLGGVTYLYCGRVRTVQRAHYPDLPSALGIPTGINAFELPVIGDMNYTFDNGTRQRARKHYIVARIG